MTAYIIEFFAIASLIAIPIYIANGLALIFGGRTRIDFGQTFLDGPIEIERSAIGPSIYAT